MEVRVECDADETGERSPRRLLLDGRALEVAEVIDRWLSVEHRYFKVRTEDGASYILRHDLPSQRWDLVMFEAPVKPR